EYALTCDLLGHVAILGPGGARVGCEIRVSRFSSPPPLLPPEETTVTAASLPTLTAAQQRLLDAITQLAAESQYKLAFDSAIRQRLGYQHDWGDFVALLAHGRIARRDTKGTPPWAWRPAQPPALLLPCDAGTVRQRLEAVLTEARGDYPRALYQNVRARFIW